METDKAISLALRRIFRPLARLAMSKGLVFQDVQKLLKQAFVDTATRDFKIDGKRLTDSRLSLLTGLQRRDIKMILSEEGLPAPKANPLARVHSQLLALGEDVVSIERFEALSRAEYQDVHPRTFLDELLRLGLVEIEGEGLVIVSDALIAQDDEMIYDVFADNLNAHLDASVGNLLGEKPRLEQAVYANALAAEDVEILQKMARERARQWLLEINELAVKMQAENPGTHEMRMGVYFDNKEGE